MMETKRDQPAPHDTSLVIPTGAAAINNDPSFFHHGHNEIMNNALFSPSPHHNSVSSSASAAKVSPFANRMRFASNSNAKHNDNDHLLYSNLFKLEPVPEESHTDNVSNNYSLSQSSTTSSLTFSSFNNNISASNCSSKVDCLSGGSTDASHGEGAMIGTMVGEVVESDVGCSVGGSGLNSISSNNFGGFHCFHQECPPPTKRARVEFVPQKVSGWIHNEDITMASNMDGMGCSGPSKMSAVKCINLKSMNIDKSENGNRLRCHVCSQAASASSIEEGPSSAAANASPNDNPVRYAHAESSPTPPPPRSHSLLAYFQPSKKPAVNLCHPTNQANGKNKSQRSLPATSQHDACRYCDKPTCITCTRQCEQCQYRFCTFCTKVDYESSVVERILCFECDEHVRANGDDNSDCDMMDL